MSNQGSKVSGRYRKLPSSVVISYELKNKTQYLPQMEGLEHLIQNVHLLDRINIMVINALFPKLG